MTKSPTNIWPTKKEIMARLNTYFPNLHITDTLLNTRKGIAGDVHRATYEGKNYALKTLPEDVPMQERNWFVAERKFLLSEDAGTKIIESSESLGIPIQNLEFRIGFIKPLKVVMASPLCPNTAILTEEASPIRLIRRTLEEDVYTSNQDIPFSIQIGAWRMWIKMLKKLNQKGMTMDSQIDDFAIQVIKENERFIVQITKIDCQPTFIETNQKGNDQSARTVASQIIEDLNKINGPIISTDNIDKNDGFKALEDIDAQLIKILDRIKEFKTPETENQDIKKLRLLSEQSS